MKQNRIFHLIGIALISCTLSQVSASETYNVYFSDPETGCLFGKTANGEDQNTYLVSGQTTLSASCLHFLDENQVLFTPNGSQDKIIFVNTETHQSEQIDIVPPGHEVQQISGA